MADEEEKKSTIEFSESERSILRGLSQNVDHLAKAIDRLTQQVMDLAKKK